MYDVLYLNPTSRTQTIAAGLVREEAVRYARDEALRRGIGRMFLAGSRPCGEVVVIVPSAGAQLLRAA